MRNPQQLWRPPQSFCAATPAPVAGTPPAATPAIRAALPRWFVPVAIVATLLWFDPARKGKR